MMGWRGESDVCGMCELALARGEEAPAFRALPVHPDYLRKTEPRATITEAPATASADGAEPERLPAHLEQPPSA